MAFLSDHIFHDLLPPTWILLLCTYFFSSTLLICFSNCCFKEWQSFVLCPMVLWNLEYSIFSCPICMTTAVGWEIVFSRLTSSKILDGEAFNGGETLHGVSPWGPPPIWLPPTPLFSTHFVVVVAVVFRVLGPFGCHDFFGVDVLLGLGTSFVYGHGCLDEEGFIESSRCRPLRKSTTKNFSSDSSTRTIMLLNLAKKLFSGSIGPWCTSFFSLD